jgi:hypothetical protein
VFESHRRDVPNRRAVDLFQCPSLINGVWIYGGSDDTLFRLVTLGSVE